MNILFADSQGVVRHGTITIVKGLVDNLSIFEADSHHKICQQLRSEEINLLLLNTDMFGEHSISAIQKFKSINPEVKILLLSTYTERLFAAPLMKAGADGFINVSWSLADVKHAIAQFIHHGNYLPTNLADDAGSKHLSTVKTSSTTFAERFSERERLVLHYLRSGTPLIKIAELLSIKPSTVSTYKCRIYTKLGIGNLRELNDLISMAS